jgi:hypothetical protein
VFAWLQAFFVSIVIKVFIFAFATQGDLSGLYVLGTVAYLVLVNCMLYKALLEMATINWFCVLSLAVSLFGTTAFVWGYSHFAGNWPEFYNVGVVTLSSMMFWLVFLR